MICIIILFTYKVVIRIISLWSQNCRNPIFNNLIPDNFVLRHFTYIHVKFTNVRVDDN